MNSPLIQQNDALAFIPFVPRAIRGILAEIEAVFIAVSLSRASVHALTQKASLLYIPAQTGGTKPPLHRSVYMCFGDRNKEQKPSANYNLPRASSSCMSSTAAPPQLLERINQFLRWVHREDLTPSQYRAELLLLMLLVLQPRSGEELLTDTLILPTLSARNLQIGSTLP